MLPEKKIKALRDGWLAGNLKIQHGTAKTDVIPLNDLLLTVEELYRIARAGEVWERSIPDRPRAPREKELIDLLRGLPKD